MKKSTQQTNGRVVSVFSGFILAAAILLFSASLFAGDIKIKEGNADLKIKTSTYTNFDFTNTFTEVSYRNVKTDKGTFCELSVPDYGFSNRVGDPKLPMLRKLIEIPYGATVNVSVISYSETEYKLSGYGITEKLMPAQPPVIKDQMKELSDFEFNLATYASDQFNADDLVSVNVLGTMRGVTIARLDIAPVRYNPVTNTIKVYNDIEVEITFQNGNITGTIANKEKTYSPYFESMYFNQLLNYKEPVSKDSLTKYPVKYVIVSPITFQTQLQPFVQWKTRKGFTVVEAYTNNPDVGTTTTSIKNYLQDLYNNATPDDPAPSFVLFVGDVAQVPSFTGNTGSHVSDLYYCEYTGDYLPEVYYGRFSATNSTQLQPQIDKTLEYEEYTMPDPSFLAECVMIAGQDATYGPLHGDGQINYGTDEYFNTAHGLTSSTYLYAVSGSSAAAIIDDVSKGVCFVNYTAHGSSDGWADPAFSISDISGLLNNHKYPLMVGNCCLTNTFDGNCFGEELLRAADKGALGYIGGSNSTYWDEDYWWGCGYKTVVVNPTYDVGTLGAYDRTFHDHGEARSEWYASQDQMIFAGNLAVTQSGSSGTEYYWEIYHLMGDPSLMIYYGIPAQLNATYTPLIPLGAATFTVNTEPWAYVAVSMNNVLYGAALADTNGVATITLDPFTVPGTADVVATKQNRSPFIDTVTVASPTGPYIVYTGKLLHDVAGNNNGQADYNENITLDITLQNVGAATANGVTAVLSTADANVTITDNTQNWGSITNGTSSTQNNAYAVTVNNYIPDQHIVNFDLAITDGSSNSWAGSFTLTLNAPLLSVGTILISDPTGNNNGRLDPGETVDVTISGSNTGHALANSVQSVLSTTYADVTLNTFSQNLGNLNPGGGAANAVFNLTVSPSAVIGTVADLTDVLTAGSYTAQHTFYLTIGLVDEDWETGDFTKFDWVQGTYPWIITGTLPYEGAYSAKSGTIADEQISDLSITFTVLTNDSISFFGKVSSEQDYDFLKFFIDGTEKGSWSGEMDWTRLAYPVTVGSHTFKWTYEKDQSVSDGSDCAWTDYILFPPVQMPVSVSNYDNGFINTLNCYPNPFTDQTTISYSLEKPGSVSLNIYNAMGQEIATLIDGKNQQAGYYNKVFNAAKLGKGIYHCVLTTPDKIIVNKLLLQ
ncbi:MAG: C25 family cysteine peptidase [Bacteroidota bacterium]